MIKGKTLSILGDSISTYKGVSDDEATSPTLKYNPSFYKTPFPKEKTYWSRVMSSLGLTLCVNNSYSGGNLSGTDNPDSGVNRARFLSRCNGTRPDIIILFMGINDLGRGVSAEVFRRDYNRTLNIIRESHPEAQVCCVNLPDRDIMLKARAKVFNEIIAEAVECAGERFFIADLFNSRLNNDFYYMNTLDGLHPDEDGMKHIAEVVEEAIRPRLS